MQQQNTFRCHSLLSQKSELALLFSPVRLGASSNAARWTFHVRFPHCVSHLDSCPQRFLLTPWLVEADCSLHLHVLLVHGPHTPLPRRLCTWPDNWHAKPHPRAVALPSTVSHIHGVDEGAQNTCCSPSQCQLICSFQSTTASRKVCQNVDWDCGCCHDHGRNGSSFLGGCSGHGGRVNGFGANGPHCKSRDTCEDVQNRSFSMESRPSCIGSSAWFLSCAFWICLQIAGVRLG